MGARKRKPNSEAGKDRMSDIVTQAVLLAGGRGTRLGELARELPKPALDVGGEPFVMHMVWNLARHGIRDVVVSCGHLADRLEQAMLSRPVPGTRVRFVREPSALGTGGGLRNCLPLLQESFFVLNADSLFDVNYPDLALHANGGAALALRRVPDVARFGAVQTRHGKVVSFAEKGRSGSGWINGGVYVLNREIVEALPDGPASLEHDLFPALAARSRLGAVPYDGFFIDIGIPEELERARQDVPAWRRKPALFLDRDGVLNVDHGYVHSREQWEWCRDAREAVKYANDRGMLVVVVTNQSGIGRGYYGLEEFQALMAWVNRELLRHGAHFDAVYHCPHHPSEAREEYLRRCSCRKPEPGMLLRAMEEWNIDPLHSAMIGDSPKDVQAAKRAGLSRAALYDPESQSLLDRVREVLA